MSRLGVADALLAQGTIYPDTIETGGTRRADVIKTHHNRVPLVAEMVRAGPRARADPRALQGRGARTGRGARARRPFLERHPFPGPGLGVRLLCSDGAIDAATATRAGADHARGGRARRAARAGRGRAADPLGRGEGGSARRTSGRCSLCGAAPWERILEVANRVYRDVDGVNRCCFDLTGRRAAPRLELLPATVTRERLDLLREADASSWTASRATACMQIVWQCPTVALPIAIDGRGRELIVARPVLSERAMTARPAELPDALLDDLRERVLALPGVSGLLHRCDDQAPGDDRVGVGRLAVTNRR